jgi:hypothetical protein
VSDSTARPDWRRMRPDQFGVRIKPTQDALFLTDEADDCGTETLDGFGFGATLWGSPESPQGSEP